MEAGIEEANKRLVPAYEEANNARFLRNDGTWQTVTPKNIGAVPTARKINGKELTGDITLTAEDIGSLPEADLPASIKFARSSSVITITLTEADGTVTADTLQLDANDRPQSLTHGGKTMAFTWEGF